MSIIPKSISRYFFFSPFPAPLHFCATSVQQQSELPFCGRWVCRLHMYMYICFLFRYSVALTRLYYATL